MTRPGPRRRSPFARVQRRHRSAPALGFGILIGALGGGVVAGCDDAEDARCGVAGCRCLQGGCRAGLSCVDDVCLVPAAGGDGDGLPSGAGRQLVVDGGFEGWIDETSTSWTDGGAVRTPVYDRPYAGSTSVAVSASNGACLEQELALGPDDVGLRYEVGAALRRQDGGPATARLVLRASSDDGVPSEQGLELAALDDGAWHPSVAELAFATPPASLRVAVCGTSSGTLTFDLDEVSVRLNP